MLLIQLLYFNDSLGQLGLVLVIMKNHVLSLAGYVHSLMKLMQQVMLL